MNIPEKNLKQEKLKSVIENDLNQPVPRVLRV